MNQNMMMDL